MENDDDLPGGYFVGRPMNSADDDLPSHPGGYFVGRPAESDDDDLPGGYFVGRPMKSADDDLPSHPGGIGLDYFVGRPYAAQGGRPKRVSFLRLAREKLLAALNRDPAAATMPSESRREDKMPSESIEARMPSDSRMPAESSKLIREMNILMTGSLKGVDRGLLETACLEISDMVDQLQANKGASVSGTSNHGPGVPRITIPENMKNIRDMLEKIDWQLYWSVTPTLPPGGYYQGRPQATSRKNGDVARHSRPDAQRRHSRPELAHHSMLKRTGRIFVDLERLVDLLLLSSISSEEHPVILPIVGLGGIGKTTLAKLVYSHTKFKDHSKSWIKTNPNDGLLFREQLPRRGGGNRAAVLVVLDDLQVKAADGDRLSHVKRNLITDVGRNAIVVVTTRSEGAAKKICTVEPYRLHADMCFATIKASDEELAVAEDTAADSTLRGVLESLKESYKLMPPDMMSCFNYCAIFPAGQSLGKDDIIHQWIALDLIDQSANSSLQSRFQVGEEYIRMLRDISFLQPAKKLASTSEMEYKGGTSFTMHDTVHALARSEAEDVTVLDGRNGKPSEKQHCKYSLLSNFDIAPMRLSNILTEHVTALFLVDCSKMELIDSSFSFAKALRVLNIREPSMKKLPGSICQLTQLTYLNLSGCSGLTKLPESFGNLTSMLYINLSGCSEIKNLPKSFGNLINVVHVNLSGCHGLDELPQSFCKLRNLEYLDLSFCFCLRELATALADLTTLRHLNLSHPCYHDVEHKHHLEQLKHVWANLTKLQYLNLSMVTNPIFCYLPEGENLGCFLSIHHDLSSLEVLDLSHNISLVDLPESLGDLKKLHTLHLSGCVRLERIARKITEMKCLKNIVLWNCHSLEYSFAVRTDEDGPYGSNIVQLEHVSCKDLEISCLEKVWSIEEAKRIRLDQKRKTEKLTLAWTRGCESSFVDDEALLAELVPPQNLRRFELKCYSGKCLPDWLASSMPSHLPNLVGLSMEDIPCCTTLPPFFLLPNLQQVALRKMAGITKVDARELSGGNRAALHGLRRFILDDLENLQEFNTIYRSGEEEFMFPNIGELVIQNCPKAKFGTFQTTVQSLQISACDQMMSSLPKRAEPGGHATGVVKASARVTKLVVKNCKVPLCDWTLLHHLPGLPILEIWNCNDLTGSPETIQVTSSLQSLCFYQCSDMTSLPEYVGDLTSLRQLTFDGCEGIKSLFGLDPEKPAWSRQQSQVLDFDDLRLDGAPSEKSCLPGSNQTSQSLPQSSRGEVSKLSKLKVMRIRGCPGLKILCESEGNKNKLSHIQIIYD